MLSIVIITKNEEKTIPILLKSIKKQDFSDYEVIVSDAKSIDNTRAIAKKYKCRIVKGGLPSVGRNNGAKAAKGNLILFLDSDTYIPKGFLKENVEEFNKKNLCIAIPLTKPISTKFIDKILYSLFRGFTIISQYFFPNGAGFCIFCKKKVFKKVKGFDEKLILGEDHDFIRRCLKYGKFGILYSKPIFSSVRRFDREGRIKLITKYLILGLNQVILGRKSYSSIFNYEMQGVNITRLNKK
ncbi:glycosyltransferase [Candidatus Pacearchaeota archaeon]|nr:glycosyltransferase [Candidatus Pacearchaeota archaeon]